MKVSVITGSGIDAEAGLPTFRGEKGYYEYFLDDKGSGSVEVYKIIEKGKSLKVKLSLTDKPLLRGDL